ncbi:hypothetical protein ZWY2020_018085 [Hordeum vulgare]|nr:hypothetical protein ZWY2020_018085 [Hordeum vulgare]
MAKSEHTGSTPADITFRLLEEITDHFSKKHKVGHGGYGQVYKGLYNGEMIAVKKLHHMQGLDDEIFKNEFNNLMRVNHQNIVRLVGYCYDIRCTHFEHNGGYSFADMEERALCFEYFEGGSLDKHISDESCGLEWNTRYEIIKGICKGIDYLHAHSIYHLDLKPENVLLDKYMTPKIGDFGFSKLFASSKTFTAKKSIGTLGYMPPEYIEKRKISRKFDVFSLGVTIIQIMAGPLGYYKFAHMTSQEFIELVRGNWEKRLQPITWHTSQELNKCLEIALRCIEANRVLRPTITEIVEELRKIDTMKRASTCEGSEPESKICAAIKPLELQFPFELNKEEHCVLQLTNRREETITFNTKLNQDKYYTQPEEGIVLPCSKHFKSMRPYGLPLVFLEQITEGFSKGRILGRGGYSKVYKGVDKNGRVIAVKKLYPITELDDEQFTNEFNSLMKIRHQNIVRLVGYCYEIRHVFREHNGGHILCPMSERILCLEYLQGGSLDKHLNEESCGHDWPTCFKIIKGICEGLSYLHEDSSHKKAIFHLDLKPANILLDKNMTPKIADFGLSRLFGGIHTHTANKCKGTEAYMPPEYLLEHKISEKNDIFSLGVIIIEIMSGQGSYSNANMSSQEFSEHVHKNWRRRLESTKSPMYALHEKDCQQVKGCIELAMKCVELDRNMRPTIEDIIHELKQIETNGSASPRDQARLAKIGQWGGVGGGSCDIEEAPLRLKSLIIGSDEVIYSLQFSYDDRDGKQQTVGPWGGHGPNGHGKTRKRINLGPSEVLTEVRGTIGPAHFAPGGVMRSLTIFTTAGWYGPFGEVEGTPFRIPVQDSGSIVGFFARAGWCIDALGIYVRPTLQTQESGLAKIGPWGGNGGQTHDVVVAPKRLESVAIRSGAVVNSLAFTYRGHDGQQHTAGPWGSPDGSTRTETVQLGSSEFLTGVRGTTDPFVDASGDVVVTSLTLITNASTYGPFGEGRGTPFQIPMWGKGSIVGFFGRAESYVNAVGVYVNPDQEAMEEELVGSREPGLTKIGPWGRDGNQEDARDIDLEKGPYRLESVTVSCGAVINSLSFSYIDFKGDKHDVGPWGTPSEKSYKIVLDPLELVQGISGMVGSSDGASPGVITSLAFATNHCRAYGPFGRGEGTGTPFSAAAETDGCVVGFFGCAGSRLEALGVYIHRY